MENPPKLFFQFDGTNLDLLYMHAYTVQVTVPFAVEKTCPAPLLASLRLGGAVVLVVQRSVDLSLTLPLPLPLLNKIQVSVPKVER